MLSFLSKSARSARSARGAKSATNTGSPLMSLTTPTPGTGVAVTISAALALLGGVLAERLAAQPLEIWADIVCWAALLATFKYTTRQSTSRYSNHDRSPDRPQSSGWRCSLTLWFVAVCVVSVTVYRAELGVVLLLPAITPLLLIAERVLGADTVDNDPNRRALTLIANSIWGSIAVAFLCVGSLVDWNFNNVAPPIGPASAILFIFIIFTTRPDTSSLSSQFSRFVSSMIPSIDAHETITSLAWRAILLLLALAAGDVYLFGAIEIDAVPTLFLGFSRALFWYFTIQTLRAPPAYDKLSLSSSIPLGPLSPQPQTQPPSWRIASTILTFGLLSTSDPFTQLTNINALAVVVASLLTLTQVTFLLPKNAQWTRLLWTVFALVPVAPFIANIAAINGFYPAPPNSLNHHEHPVEALMRNAQAYYHDIMQRQSMNVTAASNEYRRRYGIEPPPGFAEWFNFAHEMGATIIDEYDMIHNSLAPLRVLSGREIQKAMQTVYTLPDSQVWKCTYKASTRQTTCTHPSRSFDRYVHDMFNAWLGGGDFGGGVPNTTVHLVVDVTFLVNHLDEPRLLLPGDAQLGDSNNNKKYSVTVFDNKPVYDILTQHCATQQQFSTNTTAEIGPTVDTFGIPFVTDRQAAVDLCRHPEFKDMHGMLASPVSLPLIQGIVPIISCGALSSMGDILYPSPAYSEPEFMYDPARDVPWDRKKNTVYWAGSTTGAYAENTKLWRGFHRHRVVALAQNLEHSQHAYLTDEGGPPRRVFSSFLNGRLFDIAFTRVFQCDHRACRAMRSYFRQRPWAGRDDALQSHLVFGVDGNGISGRYYKLVASGSAPLKQTLLREWHDERLVPWVHYFPVSQGMEEVPELVSYLTSKRGERAARTVAENGHRWFAQAMRPADRAVYVYRLLLELARLQDPDRPAGSASVPVGL